MQKYSEALRSLNPDTRASAWDEVRAEFAQKIKSAFQTGNLWLDILNELVLASGKVENGIVLRHRGIKDLVQRLLGERSVEFPFMQADVLMYCIDEMMGNFVYSRSNHSANLTGTISSAARVDRGSSGCFIKAWMRTCWQTAATTRPSTRATCTSTQTTTIDKGADDGSDQQRQRSGGQRDGECVEVH